MAITSVGSSSWPNRSRSSASTTTAPTCSRASSNSPVLVPAVRPRVAIGNDGTRKGGEPYTMRTLFSSPGLEDVWELHFSLLSGQEYTVPGAYIANTIDQPDGAMPVGTWT